MDDRELKFSKSEVDSVKQPKTEFLILILAGIVILLIVAVFGLFIRVKQLESKMLLALESSSFIQVGGLEKGTQAPNFTLADTEGHTISRDALLGQKSLLVFSSPDCQACQLIYPHLKTISFIRSDIKVIMISKASLEENLVLPDEGSFDFPILSGESSTFNDYRVFGVPFFYLLDENGTIITGGLATTLEQIEKIIGPLGN